MGKTQPPPIEQVVEILDEIDEAIRELQPDEDDSATDAAESPEDEG